MSEEEREIREIVRQVRLTPTVWERVKERAKEARIPAAKLMALAVERGVGGSTPMLDGDLEAYRALDARLREGTKEVG
jgi:hypothetical protein